MSYEKFCDRVFKFAKKAKVEFALRRIQFSGEGTDKFTAEFPTGESISGDASHSYLTIRRCVAPAK